MNKNLPLLQISNTTKIFARDGQDLLTNQNVN